MKSAPVRTHRISIRLGQTKAIEVTLTEDERSALASALPGPLGPEIRRIGASVAGGVAGIVPAADRCLLSPGEWLRMVALAAVGCSCLAYDLVAAPAFR